MGVPGGTKRISLVKAGVELIGCVELGVACIAAFVYSCIFATLVEDASRLRPGGETGGRKGLKINSPRRINNLAIGTYRSRYDVQSYAKLLALTGFHRRQTNQKTA